MAATNEPSELSSGVYSRVKLFGSAGWEVRAADKSIHTARPKNILPALKPHTTTLKVH
jgi:hypothetical protein